MRQARRPNAWPTVHSGLRHAIDKGLGQRNSSGIHGLYRHALLDASRPTMLIAIGVPFHLGRLA